MPDSITDVAGIKVGHYTDTRRPTGCTVLLCEQGAVAGVDVRGAAPGTRETDLLDPVNTIDKVHALLLTGGSAFGLDAAGGVMRWLEEHGHGFAVGPVRVPIVPAAVLFDLWLGDAAIRPDAAAGYAACEAASSAPPLQGNVGAGAGATVGKLLGVARAMKGGIGCASVCVDGFTVAAMVAVNAVGDVIDPSNGRVLAGARSADGKSCVGIVRTLLQGPAEVRPELTGMATTIGIVATDAVLTKTAATKLAQMSHDGLARVINPVHTLSDGDVMFALATSASGKAGDLNLLGILAAEVTARAVLNAVRGARSLSSPDLPAACDMPD